MGTRKYQLQLKFSCQESWADMEGDQTSRNCSNCSKKVIDLSTKSDEEVMRAVQAPHVCARISQEQLNKEFEWSPNKLNGAPLAKSIALASLTMVAITAQSNYASQLPNSLNHALTEQTQYEKAKQEAQQDSTKLLIKGLILDLETQEKLPFVTILLVGTKHGVVSDLNGNFELEISTKYQDRDIELELSFVGYHKLNVKLDPRKSTAEPLKLEMEAHDLVLGEVIVVEKGKKRKCK